MNNKITEESGNQTGDNRLPSYAAKEIARGIAAPDGEGGETTATLKIKPTNCGPGCF